MGKRQSQIDKALASLRGERDVLDLAIRKLEAQAVTKPVKPVKRKGYPAGMVVGESSTEPRKVKPSKVNLEDYPRAESEK